MWRFRFALTDCLGWPDVERHAACHGCFSGFPFLHLKDPMWFPRHGAELQGAAHKCATQACINAKYSNANCLQFGTRQGTGHGVSTRQYSTATCAACRGMPQATRSTVTQVPYAGTEAIQARSDPCLAMPQANKRCACFDTRIKRDHTARKANSCKA